MGSLKFITTMKSDLKKKSTLRRYLHTHLPYFDHPRSRRNLHASDLTRENPSYCPRESALLDLEKVKGKGKTIGTCLSYTFSLGNLIADWLCETAFRDIAIGNWKCVYCKQLHKFTYYPKECSSCGCTTLKHVETRFKDPISGASAGIDLFVDLPGRPKLTPVELKTVSQDDFVKLKAAQSEHRIRSQLYLEIMKRDKDNIGPKVDTSSVVIFYSLKGYGKKDDSLLDDGLYDSITPFKEFEVDENPESALRFLDMAEQYTDFMKKGKIPVRLEVCNSPMAQRAKSCQMCSQCWSDSYPPGSVLPEPLCLDEDHD